ncbi:hypothetical protein ACFFX0_13730 [Citricoccus parietis]|uniref:Uncharacterized protein n=1 Tax=Citricoccus parietis TaxID=592307 RepID=A0ABV5FZU9_9MICC
MASVYGDDEHAALHPEHPAPSGRPVRAEAHAGCIHGGSGPIVGGPAFRGRDAPAGAACRRRRWGAGAAMTGTAMIRAAVRPAPGRPAP